METPSNDGVMTERVRNGRGWERKKGIVMVPNGDDGRGKDTETCSEGNVSGIHHPIANAHPEPCLHAWMHQRTEKG